MSAIAPTAHVPPGSVLSAQIRHRATTVMAKERLRSELRSIVLDILGVCDPGELRDDLAAWVERAADSAVSAVCDACVGTLLETIDATITEAPPWVVVRLTEGATRLDAGID